MPGIAFNLISIRVGEQRARGQDAWVDSRDTSGTALLPSELLNHPDTSTRQEVESTDLDQEGGEGINEGVLGINGTAFEEIMEHQDSTGIAPGMANQWSWFGSAQQIF
ncbi:hypothetical protein JOM56_012005 [Amanita muscaria]